MRTENEDCWSYPEATEEALETSSRRGRASRGGSKASAVGKRISWGSRFLTAGRPAEKRVTLPVR